MVMLLQFSSMFAAAHPVEKVANAPRNDVPAVVLGEHPSHRTIVVVFCMSYAFLLALAQGKLCLLSLTSVLELLTPYRLSSWPNGWTENKC